MNLICNHLVLNILCSPIPSVQHIIQSLDFTVLRCVTAGVPFDANIAKFRYAKSKCSHKFTHALEPVCKRLVMFHGLHIIVRLKAEQDMRRNAQRCFSIIPRCCILYKLYIQMLSIDKNVSSFTAT